MNFDQFLEDEPEWDAEPIIRGIEVAIPMINELRSYYNGPSDMGSFAAVMGALHQAIVWIKYNQARNEEQANYEGDQ